MTADPHAVPQVSRLIAEFFGIEGGELTIQRRPISEVLLDDERPAFIYDESVLGKRLRALRSTFGRHFHVFYSMKANPHLDVVRFFSEQADGIEVASMGEIVKALAGGCLPKDILFAGPGKSTSELRAAIQLEIGEIHVESLSEASRVQEIAAEVGRIVPICLRVNPAPSAEGGAMRMGGRPTQFGIDEEDILGVVDQVETMSNVDLLGLHLFAGTQILDCNVLLRQYHQMVEIAERVADRIGRPLRSVDFGGGLGIPYFKQETTLDLAELKPGIERLLERIRGNDLLSTAKCLIEPGRFLTAECGVYVTRVVDIKTSRGRKFVVVNGGMHHHLAASGNLGQTIKRNFPLAVLNKLEHDRTTEVVDVVGSLCTPLDTLARQIELPKVEIGDLVGIFCSGAYGLTASPVGFLSHEQPREIYLALGEKSFKAVSADDSQKCISR